MGLAGCNSAHDVVNVTKDLNYDSCYFGETRSVTRLAKAGGARLLWLPWLQAHGNGSLGVSSSFKQSVICQGLRYSRDSAMSSNAGPCGHGSLKGPVTVCTGGYWCSLA